MIIGGFEIYFYCTIKIMRFVYFSATVFSLFFFVMGGAFFALHLAKERIFSAKVPQKEYARNQILPASFAHLRAYEIGQRNLATVSKGNWRTTEEEKIEVVEWLKIELAKNLLKADF